MTYKLNTTSMTSEEKMTVYGYARVSSEDQDLTVQEQDLLKAGCDIVRAEKISGTKLQNREELKTLLEFVRPGDEIVITRMDRLGRSAKDLLNLVHELESKGVNLRILKQDIDVKTAQGKFFITLLSAFAEFETELRKERQAEGIANAKKFGKYKGRKSIISRAEVNRLLNLKYSKAAIARALGCSHMSVYRIIDELERAKKFQNNQKKRTKNELS